MHILTNSSLHWLKKTAAWVLVFAGIVAAQGEIRRLRGDPNQFGPFIDEPSHYVTALMIRDYAVQGLHGSPIRFAKEYYLHYPKVAFGSWPPLFHFLLAGWLMLFPATRHSAILYMDVLTALLVLVCTWLARRKLPLLAALAIGAAVWMSPVVQNLNRIVQADLQYGLLSIVCVLVFCAYLARPGALRAACFGVALLAAMMTKNNALFLAISLPVVVLLSGAWGVLRRWDIWLAAIPGGAAMLGWQYLTLPFVRNNMSAEATPGLALLPYLVQLATLAWAGGIL